MGHGLGLHCGHRHPTVVSRALMIRKHPDLVQERAQYKNAEGVKP